MGDSGWPEESQTEGAIDSLAGNTTVIAVNVTESGGGGGDDGNTQFLRPDSIARTPSNRSANDSRENVLKGKKLGHRREKGGEVTYKKFETGQLMGSIQLGIQQSVGSLESEEDRDLLHSDFYTVETVVFSRDGSLQKTPAHNYSQFKFRTYAPLAFRKFRNIFEIEQDKFLVSLCAEPMVELSNPGASGSIFYLTQDDEVIIKTVSSVEARFLQEILPAYYLNLHQNFRTLLPKFFGFYCYSCNTKNVRIVVMKNLLPSGLEIHHKFDLKGSTYGRKASKKEREKAHPTFKDLDFMEMYPEGIQLQPELYHSLMDTIERDCRALESLKIMDYSLLVGIHNIDQAAGRKGGGGAGGLASILSGGEESAISWDPEEGSGGDDRPYCSTTSSQRRPAMLERIGSFQQRQRLVAHSTALESITAEVDDAAMADMVDETETVDKVSAWGGIPAKNSKGENLLLFIGIIDILQSFGISKKLEHTLKSMFTDGDTVSVHRPSFYAARFKKFMGTTVFRKMAAPLKPTLSFRKSNAVAKRISKEKEEAKAAAAVVQRPEGGGGPHRRTQSAGDPAVTVITIGSDTGGHASGGCGVGGGGAGGSNNGGILPSVLRGKPRMVSTSGGGGVRPIASSRPDVADVVAINSCTPPPDLGGITSGDERVQIYVPSPQGTPYATINKKTVDAHKTITFLHYRQESTISLEEIQAEGGVERLALTAVTTQLLTSQDEPVSLSHIEVEVETEEIS